MSKIPFALAAALLILAVPALADEEENDWRRSGWYLILNGSYNVEDIDNTLSTPVDNSLGAGLRAGWRFKSHFAIEADFQWINKFEFEGAAPSQPYAGLDYWVWTFGLNGKAYLPWPPDPDSFWNRLQPYLLGGFGLQQSNPGGGATFASTGIPFEQFDTTGSFYGRLGGGLDLYFTRNWALGLEASVVMPVSDTSLNHSMRYGAFTWNFMYRF